MIRYCGVMLTVIFSFVVLLSCAPGVHLTSMAEKRPAKPQDAYIYVLSVKASLPKGATVLGRIDITDTGLSVNCGLEDVINKAKENARSIGADAIQLLSIQEPDFFSTCYRISAFALAFDSADSSLFHDERIGPPDPRFLAFADSYPCDGYRDSAVSLKDIRSIFRVPFAARTIYDNGTIERVSYPLTRASIDRYIDSVLALTGRKVYFPKDSVGSPEIRKIGEFYINVIDKAIRGTDSPLTWGSPLQTSLLDSTTVVYMPVAIEHESQEHVTSRFYALVADCHGRIVLARCLEFNAGDWSARFSVFERDIRGSLPMTE